MTAATVQQVFVPRTHAAPRGAQLVGLVYDVIARIVARRRAHRAARQWLQRAEEAEAVRAHARSIQASDPGMAADLLAAADRHVG